MMQLRMMHPRMNQAGQARQARPGHARSGQASQARTTEVLQRSTTTEVPQQRVRQRSTTPEVPQQKYRREVPQQKYHREVPQGSPLRPQLVPHECAPDWGLSGRQAGAHTLNIAHRARPDQLVAQVGGTLVGDQPSRGHTRGGPAERVRPGFKRGPPAGPAGPAFMKNICMYLYLCFH